MDKLKAVTEEICELLNGTELFPMEPMNNDALFYNENAVDCSPCEPEIQWCLKPIREAELLKAFSILQIGDEFAINEDGVILIKKEYEWDNSECRTWELGKSLDQQSHETINFLYKTLNCEPC